MQFFSARKLNVGACENFSALIVQICINCHKKYNHGVYSGPCFASNQIKCVKIAGVDFPNFASTLNLYWRLKSFPRTANLEICFDIFVRVFGYRLSQQLYQRHTFFSDVLSRTLSCLEIATSSSTKFQVQPFFHSGLSVGLFWWFCQAFFDNTRIS